MSVTTLQNIKSLTGTTPDQFWNALLDLSMKKYIKMEVRFSRKDGEIEIETSDKRFFPELEKLISDHAISCRIRSSSGLGY